MLVVVLFDLCLLCELIVCGVDINVLLCGMMLLLVVICDSWYGWLEVVMILLVNGVDLCVVDSDGNIFFYYVVCSFDLGVVVLLCDVVVEVDVFNLDGWFLFVVVC